MATSIHYVSPVDEESVVLLTKENKWTNIKIYANGKMLYSAPNGDELRSNKTIDIEGLGKVELHLNNQLNVTVNGLPYEMIATDTEEKVGNVSAIFWILTAFSAIAFIMVLLINYAYISEGFIMWMAEQLFAILVYGATAILLSRKVYWFYFVGASVYTFYSALILIDIEIQFVSFAGIAAFIIRFFLLFMTLRIAPTIIKQMRNQKPKTEALLDQ